MAKPRTADGGSAFRPQNVRITSMARKSRVIMQIKEISRKRQRCGSTRDELTFMSRGGGKGSRGNRSGRIFYKDGVELFAMRMPFLRNSMPPLA